VPVGRAYVCPTSEWIVRETHAQTGAARNASGSAPRDRVFDQAVIDPGTGWLFTSLLGDLEWFQECQAREELVDLCRAPGDHSGITVLVGLDRFIDLRGLRLLLEASTLAAEHGRRFEVVRPPRSLRRMVGVLGLADRLRLALVPAAGHSAGPEAAAHPSTPAHPSPPAGPSEAGPDHARR
jgi:hypothetical protein